MDQCYGECSKTVDYKGWIFFKQNKKKSARKLLEEAALNPDLNSGAGDDYSSGNSGVFLGGIINPCCTDCSPVPFTAQMVGKHTLSYNFTDKQGFNIFSCHQVDIVDVGRPVISVNVAPQIVEASRTLPYTDAGGLCSDVVDGQINEQLVVTVDGGKVDRSKEGTYMVRYNCKDSSGVTAVEATRKVLVRDRTLPVCKLKNSAPITVEASFPYSDLAPATCNDVFVGKVDTQAWSYGIKSSVDAIVNVERTGSYYITYRAQDTGILKNFNSVSPIRTVVVVDTLKPVIGVFDNKKMIQMTKATDLGIGSEANPARHGPGGKMYVADHPIPKHVYKLGSWAQAGLMEEQQVQSNVNGWLAGAFGAAVVGIALLVHTYRR